MAQYNYVQTIDDLTCSTLFDLNIYSTFEDLIDGWSSMEQSGLGTNIGFNPNNTKLRDCKNISAKTKEVLHSQELNTAHGNSALAPVQK